MFDLPGMFPGGLPPVLRVPGAAAGIRRGNERAGRRWAVLDDDPTGSQAVHGVSVVTSPRPGDYAAALARPGDTCFILTNARSLDEAGAVAVNREIAHDLYRWAAVSGSTVEIVSRGDSTLRGHVIAEVGAITAARGGVPDGVLFCPAMPDAGRYTVDDVHYAVVAGVPTPVGRTEFARDRAFGYTHSNLREFLAERSGGAVAAGDVASLALTDIRLGGPDRVAEVLGAVSGGRWIVVNAVTGHDLDVVALGMQAAQDAGKEFLVRSGPSFVRALAGIEARPPLTDAELAIDRTRAAHGLVVVGSHVDLATRQFAALRSAPGLTTIELSVPALLDRGTVDRYLDEVARRAVTALEHTDVVVATSRTVITDRPDADGGVRPVPDAGLDVARTVSAAVVALVRRVRPARPAWIIAKGGITAHDVAAHALGIRRAVVAGQFLPGQISLFTPVEAPDDVLTCRYVVFPGNVGTDGTLAWLRDRLARATAAGRPGGGGGRR